MQRLFFLMALCVLSKADTNYRLNTPIKPASYAIAITPYFNTGDFLEFTFDGEVIISFSTDNNTNQIKLHSEDLIFTAANITVSSVSSTIKLNAENALLLDQNYTFAYINLQTELQVEVEYTLKIVYRGPIRKDLTGFYRNYYSENGVIKWLGATQMEPTHARKVFPCFDEPELKATFSLTIDRPENYQPSLANTKLQTTIPLSNGYVREVFYPTPRMSTYLVAFLISEFEAAEYFENGTKEFGIFTRPEAKNQSTFAFEFGYKVVNALGEYFGIDYYSTNEYLKLDHVALPDFRAGAMENWGLVDYRESLVLYVPEESTPYYKYRVAQILAHETTHMWFGNLVTCHWWSNTWLNEGFANYFQDYITALIEPDLGSKDMLVISSVYSAYDADDAPDSPPITNNDVNSPAEISGHFGTVTYQKAGSVIRMIHHLLGDGAFKTGLNIYLETNRFTSGYPEKLYNALGLGVSSTNALSEYPDSNVEDVMNSWISQAGHPVLDVDIDYEEEIVTLTQKRFYINPSHTSNEIYKIPITYTTGISPNFENTKPVFIMNDKEYKFKIENISQNQSWVIFNVQESGFYRVNYDDHSWEIIANALKGNDREKIHHLNRAKIVNDLFALFYADEIDFDIIYEVLEFLSEETNFSVWSAVVRNLNKLRSSYLGTDTLKSVEAYSVKIADNLISKIGYAVDDTDSYEVLRNRMQILEFACKVGHEGCIEQTTALFNKLKNDSVEVSPSLRPVVYCQGLKSGTGSDFDFLRDRMASTNVANEARTIGEELGCSSDSEKLKQYLESALDEVNPTRFQDLTMPLSSVISQYNNLHLVLYELQDNYALWTSIYTTMDSVLTTVASALRTAEDFEEFESWLSSCTTCTETAVTAAKASLASSKASAEWAKDHQEDLLKILGNASLGLLPSLNLMLVNIMIILYRT